MGKYILLIQYIRRFLNFICMQIDEKFTINLELISEFMSKNCVEIYVHVYILKGMKSQLMNYKNVYLYV